MKRLRRFLLAPFGAALLAPGLAHAAENYVVVYDGAPDGLSEKLEKLTSLSLERRPYPTAAAVRRTGADDLKIVRNALVAAGYYAAEAEFRVEGESDARLEAIFTIDPGPLFRIAEHVVLFNDEGGPERPVSFEAADVDVNEDADGASLEDNQQRFLTALWGKGYPEAKMVSRRAEARLEEATARAVYVFTSGPRARFDGVEISGAARTDEDRKSVV